MRTRTRGAQPVDVTIDVGTPRMASRFASYAKALGGETVPVMSHMAMHRTAMALLRMCRRLDGRILPEGGVSKRKVLKRKVSATKERIARWQAYQQLFIELAARATDRCTDGYGLQLPRYVVLRTERGRYVAMSLWRKNAVYVARSLNVLRLPKKQAREQGAVRICRSGDWREAVLRYF